MRKFIIFTLNLMLIFSFIVLPKTIVYATNVSDVAVLGCELASIAEDQLIGDCDGQNHFGEKVVKNKKQPWMFKKGYTGDVYCSNCGKLIEKGESISIFAFYAWPLWNIGLFIVFFIVFFVYLDFYLRRRTKRKK